MPINSFKRCEFIKEKCYHVKQFKFQMFQLDLQGNNVVEIIMAVFLNNRICLLSKNCFV